jgi:hypothetical protein
MYGALRAPTSNCVVRPAQGSPRGRPSALDRRISGDERTEEEEKEDNWYSKGLMCVLELLVPYGLLNHHIQVHISDTPTINEAWYPGGRRPLVCVIASTLLLG